MLEIRKTENYAQWIDNLRDLQARARVQVRVERLAAGNPGDAGLLVKEFLNYELITAPDIGFILRNAGAKW